MVFATYPTRGANTRMDPLTTVTLLTFNRRSH
jgi:hypothetical protein